jgi:hypothetical protein
MAFPGDFLGCRMRRCAIQCQSAIHAVAGVAKALKKSFENADRLCVFSFSGLSQYATQVTFKISPGLGQGLAITSSCDLRDRNAGKIPAVPIANQNDLEFIQLYFQMVIGVLKRGDSTLKHLQPPRLSRPAPPPGRGWVQPQPVVDSYFCRLRHLPPRQGEFCMIVGRPRSRRLRRWRHGKATRQHHGGNKNDSSGFNTTHVYSGQPE